MRRKLKAISLSLSRRSSSATSPSPLPPFFASSAQLWRSCTGMGGYLTTSLNPPLNSPEWLRGWFSGGQIFLRRIKPIFRLTLVGTTVKLQCTNPPPDWLRIFEANCQDSDGQMNYPRDLVIQQWRFASQLLQTVTAIRPFWTFCLAKKKPYLEIT